MKFKNSYLLFKNKELSLLWPFYMSSFIMGLISMITPFVIIYFINLGFSFFQISIINAFCGFSIFLFEIPTGAIADSVSRKYSVILGNFITGVPFLLVPFIHGFYALIVLWTVIGIGVTFISGAMNAWVIDNLSNSGRTDLHNEFFIKNYSFTSLGSIFGPILGGLLLKKHPITILWHVLGIGILLCAGLLLFFAKEYYKPEKIRTKDAFSQTLKNSKLGLQYSFNNKTILYLILATVCTELMVVGNIGLQPFFTSLGMDYLKLGYLYSAMAITGVITPFVSRFLSKSNVKRTISFLLLLRVLLYLSLLLIVPPLYILASLIMIARTSLYYASLPLTGTFVQQFIPTKIRATVLSIQNMATQFAVAIVSLFVGALMDKIGAQKVLACTGLFGVLSIFFYLNTREEVALESSAV